MRSAAGGTSIRTASRLKTPASWPIRSGSPASTDFLNILKGKEEQVVRTLSHKLLGYALGRTILLSDQPLIDRMAEAGGDATFSELAAEIVASPQFRNRRGWKTVRRPRQEIAPLSCCEKIQYNG